MTAVLNTDLPVHRAVIQAAGPEALIGIVKPLDETDRHALDGWYERARGMSLEQFAQHAGIGVEDAAALRNVLELNR